MRALTLTVMLGATCAVQAQVHQCTDADGRKHFQDLPCADHQQATTFDTQAGNVTTIDSKASREQTQGALLVREEIREQQVRVTAPAAAETRVTLSEPTSEPAWESPLAYPGVLPYGIFRDRDRDRFRGDRRRPEIPRRVDPRENYRPNTDRSRYTPGQSRGSAVPSTPSVSQVAPRPPPAATPRSGGRNTDER